MGLTVSGVRPEAELGAKHSLALETSACVKQGKRVCVHVCVFVCVTCVRERESVCEVQEEI